MCQEFVCAGCNQSVQNAQANVSTVCPWYSRQEHRPQQCWGVCVNCSDDYCHCDPQNHCGGN